jgi:hypothetical protein
MGKWDAASTNWFLIFYDNTYSVYYKRNNIQYQTFPNVVTKSWRLITCTYDGTNLRWYADGIFNNIHSVTFATNSWITPISLAHADHYGNISLSEFRVYSRALSSSEISTLYNTTK